MKSSPLKSSATSLIALAFLSAGCAASSKNDGVPNTPLADSATATADATDDALSSVETPLDEAPSFGEVSNPDGSTGTPGTSTIYVSTDTELWKMDPSTKMVTKIGAFVYPGATENITDVAVNGDDQVWVNSVDKVYLAMLPSTGAGPVQLTLKLTLPSGSKFYALGFAPAGVLEKGEGLVAGDSLGDLYYIPTSSPMPTLTKLGSFGPCLSGDPSPCKVGDVWQLSGDVVFYTNAGSPRGLATLRACKTGSAKCNNTNDVVAEVDMTALATKSPSAILRKSLLGSSGTGFGRTFGLGAWEDKVFGFTFASTTAPAQLISIDGTGVGTKLQQFDMLVGGWSGAGVTTKAKISVVK
ncbi:MAG: hypothetical protein NVS3B20_22510 [Polyangiales bacterium]